MYATAAALPTFFFQSADIYLSKSIALYRLAARWPKQAYNRFVETSSIYPSASIYDDLAYAAAW